MRRSNRLYAGLVAVLVALLGVAHCGPASRTPVASNRPDGGPDPLGLVGMWRVQSPGERDAFLALGDDLVAWSRCGVIASHWLADSAGDFVGGESGAGCAGGPPWLVQSTGYRRDGEGYLLLGSNGQVRARLVHGGLPPSRPEIADSFRRTPTVTDSLQAALAPSAPLPTSLRPATGRDLVGRWIPELAPRHPAPNGPSVTLTADGSWAGSDGCNFSSGRWTLGRLGQLLAPPGAVTDMACWVKTSPGLGSTGPFVGGATRAGFDGAILVLLDRSGHQIGRMRRA